MRSRQLRILVFSLILTFTLGNLPVMAASRDREARFDRDRDFTFINRVIKHIKKTLRISTTSDTLTLPTP